MRRVYFALMPVFAIATSVSASAQIQMTEGGVTAQTVAGYCWNQCISVTDYETGETSEQCEEAVMEPGSPGQALRCFTWNGCSWSACTVIANTVLPHLLQLRGRGVDDEEVLALVEKYPNALRVTTASSTVQVFDCQGNRIGYVSLAPEPRANAAG